MEKQRTGTAPSSPPSTALSPGTPPSTLAALLGIWASSVLQQATRIANHVMPRFLVVDHCRTPQLLGTI